MWSDKKEAKFQRLNSERERFNAAKVSCESLQAIVDQVKNGESRLLSIDIQRDRSVDSITTITLISHDFTR
jgi:hypothetical protein